MEADGWRLCDWPDRALCLGACALAVSLTLLQQNILVVGGQRLVEVLCNQGPHP